MEPWMKIGGALIGGFALKFAWDAGSHWLKRRGQRKVDLALQQVYKAKLTPDDQDDLIAALALERAKDDAEWLVWLGEYIEKNRIKIPGAP